MENYRRSSHSVYDLKYHLVWITKYRKPVLKGPVGIRLRELIREICKSKDVEIFKGHVSRDHVHIFVSVPPHISVSNLLKSIKGNAVIQKAQVVVSFDRICQNDMVLK